MPAVLRSTPLVLAAFVAGCAAPGHLATAPGSGGGPPGGRPTFVCKGGPQNECELDVQPNGQWVPTLIEAHKGSGNKYPKIRWRLDPGNAFKFVGQGIYFDGAAASLFTCRVLANRKMVECDNDAPATPESGKYAYRVQIELDPFVWNR